jgi:hypothetical protein
LGPYNHHGFRSHGRTCTEETCCGPGWIPISEEPGNYRYDKVIADEMERKEQEIRHELMQQIIDSSEGILNTNSTHYTYLASRKQIAKESSEFDPNKMWDAITQRMGQEEVEEREQKLKEGT